MKIRQAKNNDKQQILSFCKNTFRWGDYIDRVWDKWLAEKNLLAIETNGNAVGICNAAISSNQVWIEGIRINPDFRRKGYASALVMRAEMLARRKNLRISRMIIAKNNKRSLSMAKHLGYHIEDIWALYNVLPKRKKTKARIASKSKGLEELIQSDTFSESWNWFSLEPRILKKLIKQGRIIVYTKDKKPQAIGVWNNTSKLDDDVIQLGYLNGTCSGIRQILYFIENKAYEHAKNRIQILVQDKINLKVLGLEKRMLFCLVKKEL